MLLDRQLRAPHHLLVSSHGLSSVSDVSSSLLESGVPSSSQATLDNMLLHEHVDLYNIHIPNFSIYFSFVCVLPFLLFFFAGVVPSSSPSSLDLDFLLLFLASF